MAYFLGVDGGGTHTTAWLADERGRILARSQAGPSNPLKVGFHTAQQQILQAVTQVMRQARQGAVDAVCVGLAGVDRPQVYRRMWVWLRKFVPAHFQLLTTDAAIALQAAVGAAPGIVVISGTGSIAWARDDQGHVLRAGGWGILFDDVGSGYDLGRKAVAAALRGFDGRSPPTQLTKLICQALGLREITEVVAKGLGQQQIAALFPVVLKAARRGDAAARQLCEEAGCELADLALALIRRLGWQRSAVRVVCAGGAFQASASIRRSFARRVRRHAPRARVSLLRRQPVEGALELAREAGVFASIRPGAGPHALARPR